MHKEKIDKKQIRKHEFYTLSAAVYSALQDIEAGEERFNQFLKWAREGYQEFNFDVANEIHVAEISMKPNKQIDFPENMVDWTKVGFRSGDVIKVFTQDRDIPKFFDKVDCEPQENKALPGLNEIAAEQLIPFVDDGFYTGESNFYGAQVNHNYRGYFDVDQRNRVINFRQTVSGVTKVYLEYITDGINYGGKTIIHPYAFKAIQNYIHWQRKEHDDRYGLGDRKRAEELWKKELHQVVVRNLNLTIEDIKEALRSGNKQTPKG
jgi:hypothetical protein